jgi:hypothetical protein
MKKYLLAPAALALLAAPALAGGYGGGCSQSMHTADNVQQTPAPSEQVAQSPVPQTEVAPDEIVTSELIILPTDKTPAAAQ